MEMKTLTLNGKTYEITDAKAVSFAQAQSLTEDEKLQARQNLGIGQERTFELIEDITLAEDVSSFLRKADTNAVPYDFGNIIIRVDVAANPAAASGDQLIFCLDGTDKTYMVYHQTSGALATSAKTTVLKACNDHGRLDYFVASGSTVNMSTKPEYWISPWYNIVKINLSTYPSSKAIPAGTRIRIYAVRG